MKTKKYIVAVALLAMSAASMAQTLNSAYFTEGYQYRHAMNPAYGNEGGYCAIPGLGNLNVKTYGNFGAGDVLFKSSDYGINSGKTLATFLHPNIPLDAALSGLSKGNNRVVGEVNVPIVSVGFNGFGGYNTVELNARASFGASLPYEFFEFAKNVGNSTYNIGDINMNAQAYVELAFGHSHQLTDQLRVGGKFKLLFGGGRGDLKIEDLTADLQGANRWILSGKATADASIKGFTYKMEDKEYSQEGKGTYKRVKEVDVDGGGLGGFGLAVDLGATYKIDEDWKVSAALLDLGFIHWNTDARAANSGKPFEFNGFHDVEISKSSPKSFGNQGDSYKDQLADFVNLTEVTDEGGRTTGIGCTLNVGVEYNLPVYRQLTFGLLSSSRFRGPYSWTDARLSANWEATKWLDGGVNFSVNSFTASMGWLLNIHPKGFNFFIGMDHILGKTTKEFVPLTSNASFAMGMNITW
jgi:hypothetical protein